MTNLTKAHDKYVPAWPLLSKWDETAGGKLPTSAAIASAIAIMSKPGGKPAVLNQGLRALAIGFRAEGSTDGQRSYASQSGQPHNNVGKMGDLLRSQHKSSRLEVGKDYRVTCPGGIVTVNSNRSGHVHFVVVETFAPPATDATATPDTDKTKPLSRKAQRKAAKRAKADKVEAAETVTNGQVDLSNMSEAELDALTALTAPAADTVNDGTHSGTADQGGDTLPSGDDTSATDTE